MRIVRTIKILIITLIVLFIFLPIIFGSQLHGSKLFSREDDINIKTGRGKFSLYICYLKVFGYEYDTSFSKFLNGRKIDVNPNVEEWQKVNIFSFWSPNSPHCLYHSALSQTSYVEILEKQNQITREQKEELIFKIMKSWQTNDGYYEANKILTEFETSLIK